MAEEPWAILTRRWGESVRDPSDAVLASAASEVFNENTPGAREADYREHPDAWLAVGTDEGHMWVLTLHRRRQMTIERWDSQDMLEVLWREARPCTEAEGLEGWRRASAGQAQALEEEWRASS